MDEIEQLATRCKAVLALETASLGDEYGYQSLPLCIIDAVWSIGVRYGGVKNVVSRYVTHCGLETDLHYEQHGVKNLLEAMQARDFETFTSEVFQNRQRTSTRGGILKAEAIYHFASVLHRYDMNLIADIPKILWYEDLPKEREKPYAQELLAIPGQGSGISLAYFYMLTGSTGLCKPDRMVARFLQETLGYPVTDDDAQRLLAHTSQRLNSEFPTLTPRTLDHALWKFQSGRAESLSPTTL